SNIFSLPIGNGGETPVAEATPVTSGNQTVEAFSVSRDGRWLFYDSDFYGNPDLFRMPLPGGEPQRLTTDSTAEFQPELSPDGREIAFQSIRNGPRQIFVMPAEGGTPELIATGNIPAWSRDGSRLLFATETGIQVVNRRDHSLVRRLPGVANA